MVYGVEADDLAAEWRPLTPAERSVVEALLAKAARMVDAAYPSLAGRVTSGAIAERFVGDILISMVLRVMRNPEGRRQHSQQIDDYSTSWTIDSALSTGALYLTDRELEMLAPRDTGIGVGTVRLAVPNVLQGGRSRRGLDTERGSRHPGPAWR